MQLSALQDTECHVLKIKHTSYGQVAYLAAVEPPASEGHPGTQAHSQGMLGKNKTVWLLSRHHQNQNSQSNSLPLPEFSLESGRL